MNAVADGGGGGGGLGIVVDHGTLDGVVESLESASTTLDGVGTSAPGTGDLGEAGPLVAAVLARVSEVGARIAFESSTLAAVVAECNAAVLSADRTAAESYLVSGS